MLKPVLVESLSVQFFEIWSKQWMLLAAGDFSTGSYNAMTVSWGTLGSLWEKPVAQVFVRHTRHTFQFMEGYDNFSLSTFPREYRKELSRLGTQSGRDGDKIAASSLTPIASQCISAPSFQEAEMVIECKKIYWADLDPAHFISEDIAEHYPLKDYHRLYFGEILSVLTSS